MSFMFPPFKKDTELVSFFSNILLLEILWNPAGNMRPQYISCAVAFVKFAAVTNL